MEEATNKENSVLPHCVILNSKLIFSESNGCVDRELHCCVPLCVLIVTSQFNYLFLTQWMNPVSIKLHQPKACRTQPQGYGNECTSAFWQPHSGVNNTLLICLFIQQHCTSVNASTPVYSREFKSGSFHKNMGCSKLRFIFCEACVQLWETLGTVCLFPRCGKKGKVSRSAPLNIRTDWMKIWHAKGDDKYNRKTHKK